MFSAIKLNNGLSTSITNNGQRLLYSNEIYWNNKIRLNSNIGFHNETTLSINYYNQLENKSMDGKSYIPINVGFSKNLFESLLVGNIKPYIFTEIGNLFSIKQFNFDGVHLEDSGEEVTLGLGLYFFKLKTSQYFFCGYTSNQKIDGNFILGFKLFWK